MNTIERLINYARATYDGPASDTNGDAPMPKFIGHVIDTAKDDEVWKDEMVCTSMNFPPTGMYLLRGKSDDSFVLFATDLREEYPGIFFEYGVGPEEFYGLLLRVQEFMPGADNLFVRIMQKVHSSPEYAKWRKEHDETIH